MSLSLNQGDEPSALMDRQLGGNLTDRRVSLDHN